MGLKACVGSLLSSHHWFTEDGAYRRKALGTPTGLVSPTVRGTVSGYPHHRLEMAPRSPGRLLVSLFTIGTLCKRHQATLPTSPGATCLPGDITALAGKSNQMYIGCDIVLESKPGVKKHKGVSVTAFPRREFFSCLTAPHLCKPFWRRQVVALSLA